MVIEFGKPPFKDKAPLSSVLKSLKFYMRIGEIYVAVVKKEIVGVVVFKKEQFWEGPVLIIEDLAVKEEFKKQGIGKKLMDYIKAYSKKRKIKSISFSTHKKSDAVKFYQRYGYKLDKNRISMVKKLK